MNTKKSEIILTLKDTYNRDLRKQVVKTILEQENGKDNPDYKIIDQVFAYVLKEFNWKVPDNPEDWDYTPLEIMEETFPKLESTKWFQRQILTAKKLIEMEMEQRK